MCCSMRQSQRQECRCPVFPEELDEGQVMPYSVMIRWYIWHGIGTRGILFGGFKLYPISPILEASDHLGLNFRFILTCTGPDSLRRARGVVRHTQDAHCCLPASQMAV